MIESRIISGRICCHTLAWLREERCSGNAVLAHLGRDPGLDNKVCCTANAGHPPLSGGIFFELNDRFARLRSRNVFQCIRQRAVSAFVIGFCVVGCPPVAQVAFFVKLTRALIVEAREWTIVRSLHQQRRNSPRHPGWDRRAWGCKFLLEN